MMPPRESACRTMYLVALVVALHLPLACLAQGDAVDIPDPALQGVLRDVLEKPEGAITTGDLERLEVLDASGQGIRDLTGLESATNLRILRIADNRISLLDPVLELSAIEELDISRNPLGDVALGARPVLRVLRASGVGMRRISASLPSVEVVDLSENLFYNLEEIAWFSTARELDVSGNPLFNIAGIGNFSILESLNLATTGISSLENFDLIPAGLQSLSIARTGIADLVALGRFSSLRTLDLSDLPVTDIDVLESLEQLSEVALDRMFLDLSPGSEPSRVVGLLESRGVMVVARDQRRIGPVTFQDEDFGEGLMYDLNVSGRALTTLDMARLVRVGADDEGVHAIGGIEHAYNVKVIDLEENRVVDLSPLAALGDLVELEMCDNQVEDVSPLAGLGRLRYLDLGDNRVGDLSPLEGLRQLVGLGLRENRVTDLSPLQNLTMLTSLYAGYNSIRNLEAVRDLTQLRNLSVPSAAISSLEPVSGLVCLEFLSVGHNAITSIEPLSALVRLQNLYARENEIRDISVLEGRLGSFQLSFNFLDLQAGSEARRVIDSLVAAGQNIGYEPQLPGGEVIYLPLQIEPVYPYYVIVRFPTSGGKYFQVRTSTDLVAWRREYVIKGSPGSSQWYVNFGSTPRKYIQVVQFDD